ncbi:MAG TPA: arylamine N-acetyltransferase [Gemmatimonadales bacterium]|nr:arylamine N-acetyltransferase [Gemmatimonadales bacterium]
MSVSTVNASGGEIDLPAYFSRIRYAGAATPTIDTLRAIHARHAEAIPFENLNPLAGWPVRLDLGSLQQKLVRDGRGGYCFEQNLLFKHVLEALGFRVTGLAARVLWNIPAGVVRARTHMLLRIDLDDGPRLADVGFGGGTLTGPIRLEPDIEQSTPHEPFRLMRVGQEFVMETKIGGEWKALYRFGLDEHLLPDYELSSWYLCTHPASGFRSGLMAARAAPDRRYALRNNELAVHHLDGRTERRTLTSAAELRRALELPLGVRVPDAPALDAALARLVQPL